MKLYRWIELAILVAIGWLSAATVFGQTIPGLWTCGNPGSTFQRCPCYPRPYTPWTDPITNNAGLFQYDASRVRIPISCPGSGAFPPPVCMYTPSGGYAHSETWVSQNLWAIPTKKQPIVNGFYPAPTIEMGLCDQWKAAGNTGTCPSVSLDAYRNRMMSVPSWTSGYATLRPFMDADPGCNGTVPTPTKTLTPSLTVTPGGPTPTRSFTPSCPTPTPVCTPAP